MTKQPDLKAYVWRVMLLTDNNQHGEALTLVAEYIAATRKDSEKAKDLVNACKGLEAIHKYYGDIPQHLWDTRHDLYKQCEKLLTKNEWDAFTKGL